MRSTTDERFPPPMAKSSRKSARAERRAAELDRRRSQRRHGQQSIPFWRTGTGIATIAGALGAIVLLVAIVLVQQPGGSSGPAVDLTAPGSQTPVALADGMSLGKADAPVAMDVWLDYQCPVCRVFTDQAMPSLIRDFIEPGTLRLNVHQVAILDVPPSTESKDAAAAGSCAAAQSAFWPYHDWLFANQSGENRGAFRREVLTAIAARIGLDRAAFESCLASGTNQQAAVDEVGRSSIRATPTIRVAGQEFRGVPAYEQLSQVIRTAAGTGTR